MQNESEYKEHYKMRFNIHKFIDINKKRFNANEVRH